MSLARRIRRLGRATEPACAPVEEERIEGTSALTGSLNIREVDAGSCNGCELRGHQRVRAGV